MLGWAMMPFGSLWASNGLRGQATAPDHPWIDAVVGAALAVAGASLALAAGKTLAAAPREEGT
jgi:hypothetical protein